MLYKNYVESVSESLKQYANDEKTDLFLLRNHLLALAKDIERSPQYILQLSRLHLRK